MRRVAALFVEPRGAYLDAPGVDLWDEKRDARAYAGPWPVVAHPPCARWCMLAGLVESRTGKKRGEDGGCFASALQAVRTFGGVLEHPAWSRAWYEFGLPVPDPRGGWQRGICGGWSCQVEQSRYGHPARKATWLYFYGANPFPLRFGRDLSPRGAVVSYLSNHGRSRGARVLSGKSSIATPPDFRDELLRLARLV